METGNCYNNVFIAIYIYNLLTTISNDSLLVISKNSEAFDRILYSTIVCLLPVANRLKV